MQRKSRQNNKPVQRLKPKRTPFRAPVAKQVKPKMASMPEASERAQTNTVLSASSEKLQKVLADAGLGSRREMEALIATGVVTVNGDVAKVGDRVRANDNIRG